MAKKLLNIVWKQFVVRVEKGLTGIRSKWWLTDITLIPYRVFLSFPFVYQRWNCLVIKTTIENDTLSDEWLFHYNKTEMTCHKKKRDRRHSRTRIIVYDAKFQAPFDHSHFFNVKYGFRIVESLRYSSLR